MQRQCAWRCAGMRRQVTRYRNAGRYHILQQLHVSIDTFYRCAGESFWSVQSRYVQYIDATMGPATSLQAQDSCRFGSARRASAWCSIIRLVLGSEPCNILGSFRTVSHYTTGCCKVSLPQRNEHQPTQVVGDFIAVHNTFDASGKLIAVQMVQHNANGLALYCTMQATTCRLPGWSHIATAACTTAYLHPKLPLHSAQLPTYGLLSQGIYIV